MIKCVMFDTCGQYEPKNLVVLTAFIKAHADNDDKEEMYHRLLVEAEKLLNVVGTLVIVGSLSHCLSRVHVDTSRPTTGCAPLPRRTESSSSEYESRPLYAPWEFVFSKARAIPAKTIKYRRFTRGKLVRTNRGKGNMRSDT